MLVDYHLHSPYCGHAQGKITEYIHQGIAAGLSEIGFAEHLYRYYLTKSQRNRHWDWGIGADKLVRYIDELCELKQYFADDITIRIGLEVDYIEGAEDLLGPIVGAYPLDFMLGSIHCLPSLGWKHLSNYEPKDTVPLYDEYFSLALSAVKSGLFQSLAHLDYIWRCFSLPEGFAETLNDNLDKVIKAAIASNTCLEINAAGFLWSQEHPLPLPTSPFEIMLERIAAAGAHVTMGSDAHAPETVGKGLARLVPILKAKGITQAMTFDRKKAMPVNLG